MRSNSRNRNVDPLEQVQADLAALRRDFVALTGNRAQRAADSARDMLNGIMDGAKTLTDDGKKRLADTHARVCNFASERPLTTIGLAIAAGALLSKVMTWSRRD